MLYKSILKVLVSATLLTACVSSFAGLSCKDLQGTWSNTSDRSNIISITIRKGDSGATAKSSNNKPFLFNYDDMTSDDDDDHLSIEDSASCRRLGDGSLKLSWSAEQYDEEEPYRVGMDIRITQLSNLKYTLWLEDGEETNSISGKMTRDE